MTGRRLDEQAEGFARLISVGDEVANRLLRDDHVVQFLGIGERDEPFLPSPTIQPLVLIGGEIERRPQNGEGAIDRGGRQSLREQTVAPLPQIASGEQSNGFARQAIGEMQANADGIVGVTAASFQVCFVAVHRLGDRNELALLTLTTAREIAGTILRLPEAEDRSAVGILEVVGGTDCLRPATALAIGDGNDPGARADIAPIAEAKPGADLGEQRLACDRQFSRAARRSNP